MCAKRENNYIKQIITEAVTRGVKVNPTKVSDVVNKLLKKYFGPSWRKHEEPAFYSKVIDDRGQNNDEYALGDNEDFPKIANSNRI